jgi:hypothetical protein
MLEPQALIGSVLGHWLLEELGAGGKGWWTQP